MARGKQAAKAANQRADALAEIVASGMADAKMRARQFEKDALRVSGLEAEVARLRRLNETNSSDILERERVTHATETKRCLSAILGMFLALNEQMEAGGLPTSERLAAACEAGERILDRYANLLMDPETGRRQRRTTADLRLDRLLRADRKRERQHAG